LGNPHNLAQAGFVGRAALIEGADRFVESLVPVIQAIRAEGATTLRAIAQALNRRGFKSARGGAWHPSSIANLLSRSELL
jgi:hypothetical protein